ncbi:hypothetical protein IQ225_11195, partial [Synechocystis salina LEGE 06155]|nr:hypothetical protein [Synechocystis salina LEGE 06155]
GLGNFEGPYAIEDTSANILASATSPAVLDATSVTLSDPGVAITVANAKTLQDLGNFGGLYNIEDTSAAILGNATSAAVLNAESVILSNPGVPVSVAGAQTLQGLGNFEGPYHIEDTSANILAAATTPAVLDATSVELSNPGVPVTVAEAEVLQGLPTFAGPYNIEDTSAAILAAATTGAVLDADSVTLSDPGVPVSVAGAETLQGLGNFVGPYNIEDTSAAILAAATTGAVLDADSVTLSDPGVPVTVAGAETLQGLGNFVGPYNIEDTSAAILAAATTGAVLDADSVTLSDPGVGVTVAEAEVLQGLGNFVGPYHILDTSANILAAAGSAVVLDATSVSLSDPGVGVTVDGAETLQGLGNFDGIYAIADTLANLTDAPSQLLVDATGYELTDPAGSLGIVSPAQESLVLGALNSIEYFFTTATITASRSAVHEGADTILSVNLSDAQATDTVVTFFLVAADPTGPVTGTDLTNTADFVPGEFTPITVVIPAGETSVPLDDRPDYSPFLDGITELTEGFFVRASINGSAFSFIEIDLDVLDGPGDGSTVDLTLGNDIVTATTFIAAPAQGIGGAVGNTLNTGDILTGIGDNPTLELTWVASTFGSNLIQPVMKGVETMEATLIGDDLTIISNSFESPIGFITGLKHVEASGSIGGDLSMVNLQTALESVTVKNYFFGDDVSFSIADPALAALADTDFLTLTLDQVTASPGNNTSVNVTNFSGGNGYKNLLIDSTVTTASKGITNTAEIDGILGVENIAIIGKENLTLSPTKGLNDTTVFVDASTFEGDLKTFVDTPGGDLTFLSGSGDDEISISRTAFDGGHVLKGGAGNDQLLVTGDALGTTDVGHNVWGEAGEDIITVSGKAEGTSNVGHTVLGAAPGPLSYIDGADIIDVSGDAIATTGSAGHTVEGDAGDDIITVSGNASSVSGDAGHTIKGGEDNDTISVSGNAISISGNAGHTIEGDSGAGMDTIIVGKDEIEDPLGDMFGIALSEGDGVTVGHTVKGGGNDDKIFIYGDAIQKASLLDTQNSTVGHIVYGDNINGEEPTDGADLIVINADAISFDTSPGGGGDFAGHQVYGGGGNDDIFINGDVIGDDDGAGSSVTFADLLTSVGGFQNLLDGNESKGSGASYHFARGNAGDDLIVMNGKGNVAFFGNAGEDEIFANEGDDIVSGGAEDDRLYGGNGFDLLIGGADDDTMQGDEGGDLFIVDQGVDDIRDLGNSTDDEDDQFQVSAQATALIAVVGDWKAKVDPLVGNGNPYLEGTWNQGTAILEIATPNGTLVDLSASNTVNGNPLITTNGYTVIGNEGDDEITGSRDNDTLFGGRGDDEITGDERLGGNAASGKFTFTGGNDIINGNGSNIPTLPGDDEDELVGDLRLGAGTVSILAGSVITGGDDNIDGEIGDDEIAGDLRIGASTVTINKATVVGGQDSLFGGEGNDEIAGDIRIGAGDVTITDSSLVGGSDIIDGGDDEDQIAGDILIDADTVLIDPTTIQGGGDIITGGKVNDELVGDLAITAEISVTIEGDGVADTFIIGGGDIIEGDDGDDDIVGDASIVADDGKVKITQTTVLGGNDILLGGDLLDAGDGSEFIVGDIYVRAGNSLTLDEFTFGSFNPSTGLVEVGNDFIEGGNDGNGLFGDLFFETGNLPTATNLTLIGGNDDIIGGDGEDLLVGDFAIQVGGKDFGEANLFSLSDATEFAIAGGKDFLQGGKGDDIYYGGGGIDNIDLGNNITNPFGEGLNGDNEIWFMNGASENGARNGANVDVITGFNTINDKFVIAAGPGNFLANLNLQAGVPTLAFGGSLVPPIPPAIYPVNGTGFNLAPTVTNATADNLNNVFESVTNPLASFSGGIQIFPGTPGPEPKFLASLLQMQQINVTSGALAGRQFLFINDGVAEVNTQDDFLVEITGITGTFGGAIPLTENFEVRQFNV